MTEHESRRKRGDRAKLTLAGIAVIGIGAAVTTAAWTDDVWFSAAAEAAEFDLQGQVDGDAAWSDIGIDDADGDISDDVAIAIPATAFEGIVPGFDNTVTLNLMNAGSSEITLATPTQTATGGIFEGTDPAVVTIGALGETVLAPGEETSFTVQITTDADWPQSYMGSTGDVSILVVGTAS